jgi:ubiquinone/menaquinone biosynthesis C-methylase UbiE
MDGIEMKKKSVKKIDYTDEAIKAEILERNRRGMWTPEQIASLAKHFRLKPGMKLLDVGCGHAYCLRTYGPFCMPGGELVGVDEETQLFEEAKRMTEEEGLGDVSTFHTGDVYALPFESGSFDITLCQTVFCHLDRPEDALDEMIRVTKRGGCVAVFDSAQGAGATFWFSVLRPTLPQQSFEFEMGQRWHRGRKKLGLGDFAVGQYVPGWMEAKGLKDVDVRQNEKVRWITPPYKSPAQQVELTRIKEQMATGRWPAWVSRDESNAMMRAGGADENEIKRAWQATKRRNSKIKEGLAAGTLAYGIRGNFWCIWGFK